MCLSSILDSTSERRPSSARYAPGCLRPTIRTAVTRLSPWSSKRRPPPVPWPSAEPSAPLWAETVDAPKQAGAAHVRNSVHPPSPPAGSVQHALPGGKRSRIPSRPAAWLLFVSLSKETAWAEPRPARRVAPLLVFRAPPSRCSRWRPRAYGPSMRCCRGASTSHAHLPPRVGRAAPGLEEVEPPCFWSWSRPGDPARC